MQFWNKKEKVTENKQTATKTDVLHGLRLRSAYFENNIHTHELFRPEFEISKTINSILERRDALTQSDVDEIFNLLNDFEQIEHYDGSGWYDYQIQLTYFLRLSGFEVEVKNR